MAIKVSFNAGDHTAVIGGLYQWDYGQVLEIESLELGTELMEVHFACPGMSEAIVRSCQFVDGIGTVTIPDQCLEQTGNITAWVYSISATQGHTVKTITLPITGRMRPSALRDVPPEYINKYAEAIEEINKAVNAIEKGNVAAAKALTANTAKSADTAKNAESATYATSAGSATTAGSANTATMADNLALVLAATIKITEGRGVISDGLERDIFYFVLFEEANLTHSGVFCDRSFTDLSEGNIGTCILGFSHGGGYRDVFVNLNGTNYGNGTLKFYKLGGVS